MKGWALVKFWFDFAVYVVAEMRDSEFQKNACHNAESAV